jgi:Protein of unknown function (DUF3306)
LTDEGLLSRWSRRKLQAERARTGGSSSAQMTPTEESSSEVPENRARLDGQDVEALPELSAEELVRLPDVEDLTAASDLTQFLRKGVPTALRNAALRRMWTLDPAIRDYLSEAREYAYDWNTPDGVPGSGPLLASDNVEAMLRRVVGNHETKPSPEPEAAADAAVKARSGESQEAVPEMVPREASNQPANGGEPAVVPQRQGGATHA